MARIEYALRTHHIVDKDHILVLKTRANEIHSLDSRRTASLLDQHAKPWEAILAPLSEMRKAFPKRFSTLHATSVG